MENKRIIGYALSGIILGLLAGWLLFGQSKNETSQKPVNSAAEAAESQEIWTCSMHPQIRQPEPGDCPICGMDLIPLATNSSNDPLVLEMTAAAVKLASIQTTVIGSSAEATAKTLRLSGKVQADERLAASQVAHIPGRIEKLYVSFTGEQVRQGQRLADLYAPELITAQRELIEAKKMKEVSPELLEAARNKLRSWKMPEATIQEIVDSEELQETFPIYADANGVVTQRRVAVGNYVRQGEVLFDLVNLSRVWILFDAYEEDLPDIQVGSQITFTTSALPKQSFRSRVTFIDPLIDPQTRVATIRVEVNNPGGRLKPEMLAYGTLESPVDASAALTVPKSAVLWTGIRSVVYVKMPDRSVPSFQFREVEIGDRMGDEYQVISGLEAGEEVVTHGNFVIDAAAQLNNQASMMNRDVSIKGVDHSEYLPDYSATTPQSFKTQLSSVVDEYLALKEALVSTDPAAASTAASEILGRLAAVDMSLVTGDAHRYWMEQSTAIEAHTRIIVEASQEVQVQREQFDHLSQVVIKSVKAFGVPQGTYFVQYCPMAFGDAGAEWLSTEEKIRNPYFGDQMLSCGIVKDTIQ